MKQQYFLDLSMLITLLFANNFEIVLHPSSFRFRNTLTSKHKSFNQTLLMNSSLLPIMTKFKHAFSFAKNYIFRSRSNKF